MEKRHLFYVLLQRLEEPRKFIQVLLGPRQVGKTTIALEVSKELNKPTHYISADLATLQGLSWLYQQWDVARQMAKDGEALLIIDEVQKIPNWSDSVKFLWDADTRNGVNLQVCMLGSSPWLIQKGLTESLGGRFEIIPATHWSFMEMHTAFGWNLEKYIYFGGYPGAASLADENDPTRWKNYINDAIIETTISRDILLMTQVNKPVLLRRLMALGCLYSGQILSYNKMLGELNDTGNTTTLAHYLDLLAGTGFLTGLQKYSTAQIRKKASSPKLMVYNTALMSAQSSKSYQEALRDYSWWGRLVESSIGGYLLNSIRGTSIELYYWREDNKEVDFVLTREDKLTAIEIKTSIVPSRHSGMDVFVKRFEPSRVMLVGSQGLSVEDFLKTPIQNFL